MFCDNITRDYFGNIYGIIHTIFTETILSKFDWNISSKYSHKIPAIFRRNNLQKSKRNTAYEHSQNIRKMFGAAKTL